MTIFYSNVLVCGYDKEGGIWFRERVYGNEVALAEALRRAYAFEEVVDVQIHANPYNTTLYDADGNEIQT